MAAVWAAVKSELHRRAGRNRRAAAAPNASRPAPPLLARRDRMCDLRYLVATKLRCPSGGALQRPLLKKTSIVPATFLPFCFSFPKMLTL